MPVHDFGRDSRRCRRGCENCPALVGLAAWTVRETTTSKPSAVKSACHSGASSYIPSASGSPSCAAAAGRRGQRLRAARACTRRGWAVVVGLADAQRRFWHWLPEMNRSPSREAVHRQAAVVLAAVADRRLGGMREVLQRVGDQVSVLLFRPHGIERRAVSAHHARDRGTHDIARRAHSQRRAAPRR